LTQKRISLFIAALFSVVLSGCVTQEFENDETPVVKNQANRDDMAATRISLGLGYLRMGNMPQAKQNLEKAKYFSPKMVQVYTAFAHYYEIVGEHELTIASFEEALSLKSDDADTLNNYGVYLCRQDQIEEAEKQLLKAIAVPTYLLVSKSYENLSSCFLQKDKFIKAEMYLYKAVMHSPGNSTILFQMVRLQYAMGKYAEAKAYQQRFEKVTRRFTPESLALAYKVYGKLGQRRTAKNYGTMLVKMYPQSWESQQYLLNELELIEADSLARRYRATQMNDVALKSKKRVVKLSPKRANSDNTVNSSDIAKPQAVTQQLIPTNKLVTSVPTKATIAASSIATSAGINAALTMSSAEEPSRVHEEKEQEINTLAANSTATSAAINAALTMDSVEEPSIVSENSKQEISKLPANPNEQDKHAVVMAAKVKEEGEINSLASDNKVNGVIEEKGVDAEQLSADTKDTVALLADKDIAPEDREIFHTAKKPTPIIENTATVEAPLTIASTQVKQNEPVSQKPLKEEVSEVKASEDNVPEVKPSEDKSPKFHLVAKGDTLYSISVKYNIKIRALRRWNKLSSKRKIRLNDKLHLTDPKTVKK
jgi:type IV pilus assembly protein PilF